MRDKTKDRLGKEGAGNVELGHIPGRENASTSSSVCVRLSSLGVCMDDVCVVRACKK